MLDSTAYMTVLQGDLGTNQRAGQLIVETHVGLGCFA
jgi:hypothetical protein